MRGLHKGKNRYNLGQILICRAESAGIATEILVFATLLYYLSNIFVTKRVTVSPMSFKPLSGIGRAIQENELYLRFLAKTAVLEVTRKQLKWRH